MLKKVFKNSLIVLQSALLLIGCTPSSESFSTCDFTEFSYFVKTGYENYEDAPFYLFPIYDFRVNDEYVSNSLTVYVDYRITSSNLTEKRDRGYMYFQYDFKDALFEAIYHVGIQTEYRGVSLQYGRVFPQNNVEYYFKRNMNDKITGYGTNFMNPLRFDLFSFDPVTYIENEVGLSVFADVTIQYVYEFMDYIIRNHFEKGE